MSADGATPYASIVIPTLDRSSTLPLALESVQQQTVRDIEILLVLDGATQACRDIAEAAARNDARVRVLDLPKGRGAGKGNVDLAVNEARAERIFYTDDDDLFLAYHIEKLGPLLDSADIADSRIASAGLHQDLNLAPCSTSKTHPRKLLAEGIHKTIFDTHFAHTKSAYARFANWDLDGKTSARPVWDFMVGFAGNPDCTWTCIEEVTAISLHGANRRWMTPNERTTEIAAWWETIKNPTAFSDLLARSNAALHLARLVNQDDTEGLGFEAYVDRIEGYADLKSDALAACLFQLWSGQPCSDADAIRVIDVVTRPGFVGYFLAPTAGMLERTFGREKCLSLVDLALDEQQVQHAGVLALKSIVTYGQGDKAAARECAAQALYAGPDINNALSKLHDRAIA